MNRRTLLSLCGTVSTLGLAGCVSDNADDPGDDDNGDPGSEGGFSLTPLSFENEEERPVAYSATLTGGGYDDSDGPLGIEVELTNVSDDELSYGERRNARFHGKLSDDGRFALYPGDWNDLDEAKYEFEDGCWNRIEPYLTTDDYQIGELEAGESHRSELVMTAAMTADCPDTVPDEITFTTSVRVWESEEIPSNGDEADQYEWEFRLEGE